MSYQVLARKWRPRSFPEMVGQEHVLRALINALDNDRLHHAFLFTGTRGVGKTTVARIFAKSLNCEKGVSSQPCGHCSACTEIDEGRFVDLIEVDAASRTKVEDTRELLENVQYAPSRGRFKVYLIDEVHMLSNSSFNALLKTLEEPPPHVKFLLATTDPQKLPPTILSRCLQFNLKRLSLEMIRDHLAHLLDKEGIATEIPALTELARAADGSMRDALSLLDQAIAFGGGAVGLDDVRTMLGAIDRDHIHALAEYLAMGDAQALFQEISKLTEQAPDFSGVLDDLNSLFQRLALAQMVPDAIDDSLGNREAILGLAGRMSAEDIQLFYQIGIIGRRDLPLAPDPRTGFEMVLLRMLAFNPEAETGDTGRGRSVPPVRGKKPIEAAASVKPAPLTTSSAIDTPVPESQRPLPSAQELPLPMEAQAAVAVEAPMREVPGIEEASPAGPEPGDAAQWAELVAKLPLAGMTRQMAEHCALVAREGVAFTLALDPGFENLYSKKWEEGLRQALAMYFNGEASITIQQPGVTVATPSRLRQQRADEAQAAAEQSLAEDPRLLAILETFEGEVVEGSIRPLN